MASLNKLAIRGIRSFDDKEIAMIEFFTPVTVIVGHNGSGKTTIIECLKYATTGDQPANTRGGAFIHDPKIANEKEVKAQVKLRFHAANGTRMVAVRNLSLTVKKTTVTMKTLESILALADENDKGGKRGVISTKCAEMDSEIPQLLGVSKAVLENVIFCHQEDSYWPLAEPSALKKKFDDIFEATKYTKALDSIKALRKDRAAELKADKERLVSLSVQKGHADKLKGRIQELATTIATKEVQYENIKQEYDEMVETNARFYEQNKNFREVYIKVEQLTNSKTRCLETAQEIKAKFTELPGTDEELVAKEKQFTSHITTQKQKLGTMERELQDVDNDIQEAQAEQRQILEQQGRLKGEAEEQKRRIAERETLIRDLAGEYGMKGFNQSPLAREKVLDFIQQMNDLLRHNKSEVERLQADLKLEKEQYDQERHEKERARDTLVQRAQRLRDDISDRQTKISRAEQRLEGLESATTSLILLQKTIEDKQNQLKKARDELKAAQYDMQLNDLKSRARELQAQREDLDSELETLSTQADSRATLGLKKTEFKNKSAEIEGQFQIITTKLKPFKTTAVTMENAEAIAEKLYHEKEQEEAEAAREVSTANTALQKAEADANHVKNQIRSKKAEMIDAEKKIKARLAEVDFANVPLDQAIIDATAEVNDRQGRAGSTKGSNAVYERLLKEGKRLKRCGACTRDMDAEELAVFEKHITETMEHAHSLDEDTLQEEIDLWSNELKAFQNLLPLQARARSLRDKEIPELEAQLQEHENDYPNVRDAAEQAEERLATLRHQVKELSVLRQTVSVVATLRKDVKNASSEIDRLESLLSSTGSKRTANDVRAELSELTSEVRRNERDKNSITMQREQQNERCQSLQNELHRCELEEGRLQLQIRDKDTLEAEIKTMREEITKFSVDVTKVDQEAQNAQAPIDNLQSSFRKREQELQNGINQANQSYAQLNKHNDRLSDTNKSIERYVKDRKAHALEIMTARLQECDQTIQTLTATLEELRESKAEVEREINTGGATMSNLRDNILVRKFMADAAAIQAQIDTYDMVEAGEARKDYEEKYGPMKQCEQDLNDSYNRLGGELGTLRAQLATFETDLKAFKDVYKQYTQQLIKVKMSDMANSDLEKYAKALDNAIMKYHGLKMEEVNDTMKHLWNKTYQGTDIDGIKIVSDAESSTARRTYNYRVVMTKDQVEMDMRGRCSAGQKMLASIIIRLALSDSFGQNCGILALDEPTNALDTENIDALASSLVDIINERKSHSSFQLIVITHDENFLQKLGQADVMEYYWRVSRDGRQKSVIERQRFR